MKSFKTVLVPSVGLLVVFASVGASSLPSPGIMQITNSDFECPRDQGVGYHPHPEKCELYYGCSENFTATLYSCPRPQLFDLRYSGCNWPELTHCQNRTRPGDYPPTASPPPPEDQTTPPPYPCPADLADEKFPDANDCSAFYRCVYGTSYHYRCGSPLLYNVEIKECDWRQNVHCGSRPIP